MIVSNFSNNKANKALKIVENVSKNRMPEDPNVSKFSKNKMYRAFQVVLNSLKKDPEDPHDCSKNMTEGAAEIA